MPALVPLDPTSPEDIERMWDLMTHHHVPTGEYTQVQFGLACPDHATGEFLAQYLAHSADFTAAVPCPRVSEDGREYWDLAVTSYGAGLSLAFLRQVCRTVRVASARFGCRVYAWERAAA